MNYLLYNPFANNSQGEALKNLVLKELEGKYQDFIVVNVIGIDTDAFLNKLTKDDFVLLIGGDGTLNHFANAVYGRELPCPFYLYKGGNGNDFLRDVSGEVHDNMLLLNKYVKKLPKVIINGVEKRFINGIGYGIDGLVCQRADEMKAAGKKKINYTTLSIKLMFHGYRCPNATVVIDGVKKEFKHVWLGSTMNGRYYGGGMEVAPSQDRLSDSCSVVFFYGSGKIKTLMIFPKIFKGQHIKHTKNVQVMSGKDVTVTFSLPTALQIDGEVVKDVTSYRVIKD